MADTTAAHLVAMLVASRAAQSVVRRVGTLAETTVVCSAGWSAARWVLHSADQMADKKGQR